MSSSSAFVSQESIESKGDRDNVGEYDDIKLDVFDMKGNAISLTYENILNSCRSVEEFEKIGRIGEGTYGIVCK